MQNRYLYLDGLRGIAALIVVVCHFFQMFIPAVFSYSRPTHGLGEHFIAQTPFNILINGNFAVCLFFVLSGVVLSLPYFARQDCGWYWRAAIKRYPRLAIPAVASTVFAWVLAETVGFHYGGSQGLSGADMRDHFSEITSFQTAVWQGLLGAFFFQEDTYNRILWTIRIELVGSFLIFATVPVLGKYRVRWIAYAAAIVALHDSYLLGFVLGALIADLHLRGKVSDTMRGSLAFVLLIIGIYLGAYPYYHHDVAFWKVLPAIGSAEMFIFWHIIGSALIIFACMSLKTVQVKLEIKLLQFLGRISYSMYLLHYMLLGSVGALMMVRLAPALGYQGALLVSFLTTAPLIGALSYLFTRAIDEPAVNISARLGNCIFPKRTSLANHEERSRTPSVLSNYDSGRRN